MAVRAEQAEVDGNAVVRSEGALPDDDDGPDRRVCVADPGPLGEAEIGADRLLDDPARRLEPRDAEAAAEVGVRV